jgi:hypothetical protein
MSMRDSCETVVVGCRPFQLLPSVILLATGRLSGLLPASPISFHCSPCGEIPRHTRRVLSSQGGLETCDLYVPLPSGVIRRSRRVARQGLVGSHRDSPTTLSESASRLPFYGSPFSRDV